MCGQRKTQFPCTTLILGQPGRREDKKKKKNRGSNDGAFIIGQAAMDIFFIFPFTSKCLSSAGVEASFLRRLFCPSAGRKTESKKNKR